MENSQELNIVVHSNHIVFIKDGIVEYTVHPDNTFLDVLKNISSYVVVDASQYFGTPEEIRVGYEYGENGFSIPEGWQDPLATPDPNESVQ